MNFSTKWLLNQNKIVLFCLIIIVIHTSSEYDNNQNRFKSYQNLIVMISGNQPSINYLKQINGSNNIPQFLLRKSKEDNLNYLFFAFGLDMNEKGQQVLKYLACNFEGIYMDISDLTHESQFMDQAAGFFEYLRQGNQYQGFKFTDFYQDSFGLGKVTTLTMPVYYTDKKTQIKRLIGVIAIDILLSQILKYTTEQQFRTLFIYAPYGPFKKNIHPCYLQTLRSYHRCNIKVNQKPCPLITFHKHKIKIKNYFQSIFQMPIDKTTNRCCGEQTAQESQISIIIMLLTIVLSIIILIKLKSYYDNYVAFRLQQNNIVPDQQLSQNQVAIN